jgi:4-amino-4-deoxy-L-arabinose transferase-like glycosyltransferase
LIFRLGTAALLDIQVTFFFILSVILTYKLIEKPNIFLALALGLVISAGLLTKYTMIFIIPLIFVLYLISRNYIKPAPYFTLVLVICGVVFISWLAFGKRIGVSVPGVAVLEYLNLNKTIQVGDQTKFTQPSPPGMVPFIDIGWYLTSQQGIKALINNLGTKLSSAIGPYNIPLIMLGFIYILKRRSKLDIILLSWIVTVFALLVLTLPDHRYFMPIFPAVAIMMAAWLKVRAEMVWGVITLTVLYLGASLYLFADWFRVAELF